MEAHTKPAKNSKVVPKTHKEIKLADFLEKRKPTDCLNGLDLPVFNNSLNQPSVITYWCLFLFAQRMNLLP